jgi:hypothetical protein
VNSHLSPVAVTVNGGKLRMIVNAGIDTAPKWQQDYGST